MKNLLTFEEWKYTNKEVIHKHMEEHNVVTEEEQEDVTNNMYHAYTREYYLLLNEGDKFYPNHHMWTYCTFLGKYTASNGENYDLGIYKHPRFEGYLAYSNATVWGPEDEQYSSGSLMFFKDEPSYIGNEVNAEVVKRARAKGFNVELKEISNS
jgi:hypothetical protein